MTSPMVTKVRTQHEAFTTFNIFVGLLIGMGLQASIKSLTNSFPTFVTFRGFLSSVDSPMLNKG